MTFMHECHACRGSGVRGYGMADDGSIGPDACYDCGGDGSVSVSAVVLAADDRLWHLCSDETLRDMVALLECDDLDDDLGNDVEAHIQQRNGNGATS